MPTKCKLITIVRYKGALLNQQTGKHPGPGDMWYDAARLKEAGATTRMSRHFLGDYINHRDPIVVVLPNGQHWCVDERAYKRPKEKPPEGGGAFAHKEWELSGYEGDGWTVTGEPPHLTVKPSINTRSYHGTLTDGILSDDLGGHVSDE